MDVPLLRRGVVHREGFGMVAGGIRLCSSNDQEERKQKKRYALVQAMRANSRITTHRTKSRSTAVSWFVQK